MAKDIASTSLLDEVHYRGITVVDFLAELEKARKLPTGRLWGRGLPVIPTVIIRMFIRTEMESDCLLHLHWVQQMLPYCFVAGHSNCARYKTLYLRKCKVLFLLQSIRCS